VTQAERNKRRALIVRRWTRRVGHVQREPRRKRREAQAGDLDEIVGEDDLLAELPEGLVG
jgi:hypothetical protein